MLNIVISFLTFVLIILSMFMVLVILMQRASTNAGMGSAFGGGAAESAFGADTANILTRSTKYSAIGFFIISLTLYLLYMYKTSPNHMKSDDSLPDIPVAEAAAPAMDAENAMTAEEPVSTADEAKTAAESAATEATTETTSETAEPAATEAESESVTTPEEPVTQP